MASRPDGDVWNIVDNDKDSQHYGRNFKFDFSYISSEEIKDVVKDYVWQNYRVGNKSLYTLYGVARLQHSQVRPSLSGSFQCYLSGAGQ